MIFLIFKYPLKTSLTSYKLEGNCADEVVRNNLLSKWLFFFCGLVRDWERCCNVVGRPGDGLQINENGGKTLDT